MWAIIYRWQPINDWSQPSVHSRGQAAENTPGNQTLIVESSVDEEGDQLEAFLRYYLDLNRDLSAILDAVDIDPFIHHSIETFWGMRILNQEVWECLASFILSQNNNVPRIKGIIRTISAQFGEKITLDDSVDYSFPIPQALAEAGVETLYDCGLGYRAPYLWRGLIGNCSGRIRS